MVEERKLGTYHDVLFFWVSCLPFELCAVGVRPVLDNMTFVFTFFYHSSSLKECKLTLAFP